SPARMRRGVRVLAPPSGVAARPPPVLPLAVALRPADPRCAVSHPCGVRAGSGEDRPRDRASHHGAHPGERDRRPGPANALRGMRPRARRGRRRMTAPSARKRASAIERGLDVLAATQDPGGSWKGDYGGPLFLVPVYVAGLELLGRPPDAETRDGFITYLRGHQ